ncbi:MAG: DUF973 family protein [Candidatus Bathyarchaeota archaeon]|jgi:uncharacterized membrane protein
MSLESNKTLAGVGAILVAIPVVNLVGIILVLIAMKGLAEYYNDNRIFENALYGFIFGIVAIVSFIVVLFAGIFTSVFTGALTALALFIVAVVVMFVFFLLQAVFYRNSFTILSEKSGEKMFDTAGLLLLIGAILTIILVGAVLQFIAWILAAVGFFSIKTTTTQVSAAPPSPPPPPSPPSAPTVVVTVEKKYCRYCGTENQSDAVFCAKCGKKIAEE